MKSCNEINDMMSLYIDEMLDDESCKVFEQHISTCQACKAELDEIKQVIKLCQDTPDEDLPFDFKETLHEKLLMEKAKEDKSKKVIQLFGRYAKIGSSAAAILILVIAFKWMADSGNFSSKTYDSAANESIVSKAEVVDSEKAKNNRNQEVNNGKKSVVEDKASAPIAFSAEPDNTGVNGYASYTKDSLIKSNNPSVNAAGKEDGQLSSGTSVPSVEFDNDQATKTTDKSDISTQYSINSVTTTADSQKPFLTYDAAKIEQRSTSIKIYYDSPEKQVERLKTLSIEFDGDIVNPENAVEVSGESVNSSTITLTVKIPNAQVIKFEEAIKSGSNVSNIEVGNPVSNDITNKISELDVKLSELDSKISQNQNDLKISNPVELEKLTEERDKVKKEVENLKKNSEYTYITFYIYKE